MTRYLIPALPFIALALAMVLWRRRLWPRVIAVGVLITHAILSWPSVVTLYCGAGAWRILDLPWRTALRIESEEHFLASDRGLGDAAGMCKLTNKIVPEGQTVFTFATFPTAYVDRDIIVAWDSAFGDLMQDTLETAARDHVVEKEYRFAERQITKIRLTAMEKSIDSWGINELRFYRGADELRRDAKWRLTARPNRWDVQLAFDNNPVTRWSTWQPYEARVYLEVDFGGPARVDAIVSDCWPDESGGRVQVQEWSGNGWENFPAAVSVRDVPAPARMRRAAIELLKSNNLHWLLFNLDDGNAKDFGLNHAQWGMTLAGSTQQYRLYHLD